MGGIETIKTWGVYDTVFSSGIPLSPIIHIVDGQKFNPIIIMSLYSTIVSHDIPLLYPLYSTIIIMKFHYIPLLYHVTWCNLTMAHEYFLGPTFITLW